MIINGSFTYLTRDNKIPLPLTLPSHSPTTGYRTDTGDEIYLESNSIVANGDISLRLVQTKYRVLRFTCRKYLLSNSWPNQETHVNLKSGCTQM